jgi:Flp pilus assembly protein TadG
MSAIKRHLRPLARAWLRFQRERRGDVAIFFALALIPILAFVGAAVDYSRANAIRADLQAALDSTALMVSKNAATQTGSALQTSAQNYFNALFNNTQAQNLQFTASYSSSGGSSVAVNASADMPTTFMAILGFKTLTVTGSSTAKWGSARLRVALVLDNTGSMADDGKIGALQTATKNLLTQLQTAATHDGDVYVSIIPFGKDVNVGAANYAASWENWIDWTPMAPANSMPSASVGPGSSCPYSNSNNGFTCVTRPAGTTTTSTVPSSGTYLGDICPSNSIGCYDSTPQTTTTSNTFCTGSLCSCFGRNNCTCSGSGYSRSCSQTTTTTTYLHNWFIDRTKWSGCVTDRGNASGPVSDYDRLVTAPTANITATEFPAEQYSACPQAMMGLNYNWSAMTTLVNGMTPNGATNQPIGLVWGWQSLVGGGPLTAPAMDSNYTYQQVIILLSDGLNTQDRWYGDGAHVSSSVDNRMQDSSGNGTCANIKGAGITIYAIQVNTGGDPTSTLLRNCASASDKFFLLTSANQIVTTFNTIGTNLTKLRIAQ